MLKKILGISIITASLFATSIDNKWEVGVGAGYMNTHNSNQIDNYGLVNVRAGKYLPKNHILRIEFETGDSADLTRILLNVEHYFPLDSKFTPYAYLGGGKESISHKTDYDNNDFVADLGLGAKYALTDKFNLFAEARALRNFSMNDNHYGAIAGINYEFGKSEPKIVDSDNYGIYDNMDKCPNTPAGVKVDTNGCPVTFNFDVHFKFNSTKLISTDMPKVDEFVKFLKENPAYKAEIQGYTDNIGPKSYNIKLSEKRAKVIYDYLIKSGISADRLSYKGYGPANPIADNSTKEGRQLNRRVVAKLSF